MLSLMVSSLSAHQLAPLMLGHGLAHLIGDRINHGHRYA
jgi:hypothetical protein